MTAEEVVTTQGGTVGTCETIGCQIRGFGACCGGPNLARDTLVAAFNLLQMVKVLKLSRSLPNPIVFK